MLTVDDVTSKDPPLFLQSGPQFTKILVDSNVRNVSNPVLFIGTSKQQDRHELFFFFNQ